MLIISNKKVKTKKQKYQTDTAYTIKAETPHIHKVSLKFKTDIPGSNTFIISEVIMTE